MGSSILSLHTQHVTILSMAGRLTKRIGEERTTRKEKTKREEKKKKKEKRNAVIPLCDLVQKAWPFSNR